MVASSAAWAMPGIESKSNFRVGGDSTTSRAPPVNCSVSDLAIYHSRSYLSIDFTCLPFYRSHTTWILAAPGSKKEQR